MASILKVNGKWRALIRRKGFRPQCRTFGTKAEAEVWARGLEASMDSGKPVTPDTGRLLVADLLRKYRRLRESARPISDSSNEHYMLRRLEKDLGELRVAGLTPAELVAYCQTRKEEGAGPYTVNMEISKLGTVFRYAGAALGLPPSEVVAAARPLLAHMGLVGGGGRRERRPTEDEFTAVVDHLRANYGDVYADATLFAVATAMRRGEITRIVWSDVDENKRLVLVRERKDPRNKKGNDQWVPLLGPAWEILQRQPRDSSDGRIFPVHQSTLSKYFTWSCRDLKIVDLHFHDLRHEGTSRLFEEGYLLQQVALVTGHKDWRHLRRYTNLRPEDLHRAIGKQGGER